MSGRHSRNPSAPINQQLKDIVEKLNDMADVQTGMSVEQKTQGARIKVLEDRHVIKGTRSHMLKVAAVGAGLGSAIASGVALIVTLL